MTKVIRAGCLIDGTGQRPLHDAVVVIEDGKIKKVGPAEKVSFPEKCIEIDASDRTVMPGLIDAHVHLALGASDDPIWNKVKGDLELLCLYAAGNAQRALASGITTLGDCGGVGSVTIRLREAVKARILAGPRLVVSGKPITTTSGHLYWIGVHADNADELRKSIRQLVEKGVDFIKIMATGGAMTPISNRRRAQYSEAELTAAVEDAHRLKRRVVVHVNGTEGIRNSVKAGVDVLAHCNWMGKEEDSMEYDESVAKLAADKRIYADLGPIGGFTEQDSRWSLGCKMKNLGVNVYLSSDGIGRQAARFPADVKSLVENTNITPLEAIKMATKIPAEAMGLGERVGTIEPGKAADMLIVDGNPVDDMAALLKVDTVLLNGEVMALKGNLRVCPNQQ